MAQDLTAPLKPLEPQTPEVELRGFDDIPTQRRQIYSNAHRALATRKPTENATHRLEISDLRYQHEKDPSLADEKAALMQGGRLARPLVGTLKLIDRQTNKTLDQKTTVLAHVPHLGSNGLFIHNGNEWLGRHQQRLRHGIYTHERKDGSTETQFNVQGSRGFRIQLEPKTGVFRFSVGQSHTRLYPLLRSLGVPDQELEQRWGKDLFRANWRPTSGHDQNDLQKVVQHLGRPEDHAKPITELHSTLRGILERSKVEPEVTELTMGRRVDHVTPDLLVDASHKILKVNRGEAQGDNRDSQAFQRILGPEDLIAERLARDPGKQLAKVLYRATKTGKLDHVQPGLLTPNIHALYNGTGLMSSIEGINPAEIHDLRQSITRLGEGGIGSAQMVSREAQGIQPSYLGVIDPVRAPEGSNIGLDLRVTDGALKGSDGKLYGQVIDAKTGKKTHLPASEMTKHPIAFPSELASGKPLVRVIEGERMRTLPRDKVKYEVPHGNAMFSRLINLVPMPQAAKGQRVVMGARMIGQSLPLEQAEVPLVRGAGPDGEDLHERMAEQMGARRSQIGGRVVGVSPQGIELQDERGQRHTVELYDHRPGPRKTYLTNEPVVKVGDTVTPGQVIAKSNFTDQRGRLALGRNLRVGYVAGEGKTYEDSIVISESAAKKLSSLHGYKHQLDLGDRVKPAKLADYTALYPDRFKKDQLGKLDEHGVVKVGQLVNPGDPVLVALGQKDQRAIGALMRGGRDGHHDLSQTWDHTKPGIVTDVVRDKNQIKVLVKSVEPMTTGSKLSGRYGNKGIVSEIRPDDQMPHSKDGKPLEVLMSTMGLISRVNPNVAIETLLGKVAAKTGKDYLLKPFDSKGHLARWALEEARRANVDEREDLIDPRTGRVLPQIFTGVQHVMKLHHTAESKIAARDTGSYTVDDAPAKGGSEGSKRIGGLDLGVLISSGATEFLKDAKLVRGQRNDDYWRAIKRGESPAAPNHSFANDHFRAQLQAAGVHLRDHPGGKIQLSAMTDRDVDALQAGEITSTGERGPATFDYKTMRPVEGGLFDLGLTGGEGGTRWSKITLPHKIPHPLFEEPIKRILGLTGAKFEAVMRGQEQLGGKTGVDAIGAQLQGIDLDREIEAAKHQVAVSRRSTRDAAVKRLGVLVGLKHQGISAGDLMISKVPVLPPKYRPVVRADGLDMINDANYLYNDLIHARTNVRQAKEAFGEHHDQSFNLYRAVKAVAGTGDPLSQQAQDQGVRGMLRFALGIGDSPKFARFQKKVLGTAVDTVGRSVITTDPDLDMDHVGVPEDMAWTVFRPRVIQHLVRQGTPPAEAVKAVRDRTPEADKALNHVMDTVPVAYNRAPSLHKLNYVGGWARRRKDNALAISAQVTAGMNADFDGDQLNLHVPSTEGSIKDLVEKLMPSKNLIHPGTLDVHLVPRQDFGLGLFLASEHDDNSKPRMFADSKAALEAYRRGEIKAQDRVQILNH